MDATESKTEPKATRYLQATTQVLHTRPGCGITRRTRYNHFKVELTASELQAAKRCARCH